MGEELHHHRTIDASSDQAWPDALARSLLGSPLPTIGTNHLADGNPVAFVNDAYLAMTGHVRSAVQGRSVVEVLGDRIDAPSATLFRAALADGRSGTWRMQLTRADNTAFPAIVYSAPVRDGADRLVGHCISIVDLTTIGRSPGERGGIPPGIYDKAPGFIAISRGADHRIEYVNASYREFVKRDDLLGKTVAEALPEVAEQGIIDVLDEVYRTGQAFRASDVPISIRDPATGGLQQRWMDVLYQPVRDNTGTIVGLFCEGQDVTDLHELNATLAALEMTMVHASRVNAMGTMAATLAHELNQPLTAITNYLAGARSGGAQTPQTARLLAALDGIHEATQRAAGILDHLRQMTKHRKPERVPFNLREAAEECVRLVESSCRLKIGFDNRIAADTVVIGDRVKIQQVLINLLQNACEAMTRPERARVTIAAITDEQGVTVSVADTGPGMSREAMATMFSWTESAKDNGMGIGLSICRTIVELHRGRIWLERSGPEGSEFRFRLPAPSPSPAPPR